jgi:uncharacterized protein
LRNVVRPPLYFDSSGHLKRYLRERGSSRVLEITDPARRSLVMISGLTPVEVIATFRRQGRPGGVIDSAEADRAVHTFRSDLDHQYVIVDLTPAVLNRASELADRHALRGSDAVQLGAALEAQDRGRANGLPPLLFISSDKELNGAAVREGLSVENPEDIP